MTYPADAFSGGKVGAWYKSSPLSNFQTFGDDLTVYGPEGSVVFGLWKDISGNDNHILGVPDYGTAYNNTFYCNAPNRYSAWLWGPYVASAGGGASTGFYLCVSFYNDWIKNGTIYTDVNTANSGFKLRHIWSTGAFEFSVGNGTARITATAESGDGASSVIGHHVVECWWTAAGGLSIRVDKGIVVNTAMSGSLSVGTAGFLIGAADSSANDYTATHYYEIVYLKNVVPSSTARDLICDAAAATSGVIVSTTSSSTILGTMMAIESPDVFNGGAAVWPDKLFSGHDGVWLDPTSLAYLQHESVQLPNYGTEPDGRFVDKWLDRSGNAHPLNYTGGYNDNFAHSVGNGPGQRWVTFWTPMTFSPPISPGSVGTYPSGLPSPGPDWTGLPSSTDANGSATINALIAAAGENSTVTIPTKIYTINAPITPLAGQTIRAAAGVKVILKAANGYSGYMIALFAEANAHYVTFQNLRIDGNFANRGGEEGVTESSMVYAVSTSGLSFVNCDVSYSPSYVFWAWDCPGLSIRLNTGSENYQITRIDANNLENSALVEGNSFINTNAFPSIQGIEALWTKGMVIKSNTLAGFGLQEPASHGYEGTWGNSIYLVDADGYSVENNNCQRAYWSSLVVGDGCTNGVATHNYFDRGLMGAQAAWYEQPGADYLEVTNNVLNGGWSCGDGGGNYLTFTGNLITCDEVGMDLSTALTVATITDNTFTSRGGVSADKNGMYLWSKTSPSTDVTIERNLMVGFVKAFSINCDQGQGTVYGLTIVNNQFSGCTYGVYLEGSVVAVSCTLQSASVPSIGGGGGGGGTSGTGGAAASSTGFYMAIVLECDSSSSVIWDNSESELNGFRLRYKWDGAAGYTGSVYEFSAGNGTSARTKVYAEAGIGLYVTDSGKKMIEVWWSSSAGLNIRVNKGSTSTTSCASIVVGADTLDFPTSWTGKIYQHLHTKNYLPIQSDRDAVANAVAFTTGIAIQSQFPEITGQVHIRESVIGDVFSARGSLTSLGTVYGTLAAVESPDTFSASQAALIKITGTMAVTETADQFDAWSPGAVVADPDFIVWLESSSRIVSVLVEVAVKNNSAIPPTEITRYLSSTGYTSRPADSPANQHYIGVVDGGATINEQMSLTGEAAMSFGDVELSNAGGALDSWLDDVWTGRVCRIYVGDHRWARASFRLIFDGVVSEITSRENNVLNLVVRDKLQRLNTAVSETKLGGVSVNADRILPITLGEVSNVVPLLVDKAQLLYRVHDVTGTSMEMIIEVRDNGVPVETDGTVADSTGTFKLVASPAGMVTASVQGDKAGGVYYNTVSRLVQRLVTGYGKDKFVAADLDTPNLLSFNAANQQPVGVYIDDRENVLALAQLLAASVGAQLVMPATGKLRLLKVALPAVGVTPTRVDQTNMYANSLSISQRPQVRASVKIGYCRNYSVQPNLATGIPAEHKDLFAQEWITATAKDSSVATEYKLTQEPEQEDTYLISKSSADAEATRRLNLWKVQRTVFRYQGTADLLTEELGSYQTLYHQRFGLVNGKTGQIISIERDWLNGRVIIEVLI